MDRNRILTFAAALAAVVVLASGYFLGVQPQLVAASTADSQRTAAELQNAQLRETGSALAAAKADFGTIEDDLAGVRGAVPSTASMDSFIDSLHEVAEQTGMPVTEITTADAVPYAPPADEPVADAAAVDEAGDADADASADTAAVAPVEGSATGAVTNPLINSENLSALQVSLKTTGTFSQIRAFLAELQGGQRLYLVTSIASAEADQSETGDAASAGDEAAAPVQTEARAGDWTITGYVYVLSAAQDVTADEQPSVVPQDTAAGSGESTDTAAGR
jgi:Tfp pilus assembly protein PilO